MSTVSEVTKIPDNILTTRIQRILNSLNKDIHEREEVIAVSFLAALADQNIFLLGPPGTAKSLISRRLSNAFDSESYFEYLMQRFSTPEEVFGPVSISELKKDNYIRKTDGFLPKADFAFLDEIWKSSPAILNTLLTVINEKVFRNGVNIEKVPLKVLISASNETPPLNQGLEALYDRFLVRMFVPPMKSKDVFNELMQSKPTLSNLDIDNNIKITHEEWENWAKEKDEIKLSTETLNIIHDIRKSFEERKDELNIYVSDRRWQRASMLLKAAAYFCGREETNIVDALLLRHCLWTDEKNRNDVVEIVEEAVLNSGFDTEHDLKALDISKEKLNEEIEEELFNSTDIYETFTLDDGNEYFKYHYEQRDEDIYILAENMKSEEKFYAVDKSGNNNGYYYEFDTQGSCIVKYNHRQVDFTPKVLFHKGDKKLDVNQRLIDALRDSVLELKENIEQMIAEIDIRLSELKKDLYSPFVPEKIRDIALQSIINQRDDMKLRLNDCDRLDKIIG